MAQSARQMANNQRRTLYSMQQRLLAMAAAWGDLDSYNMDRLEDLARECASVSKMLVTDTVYFDPEEH